MIYLLLTHWLWVFGALALGIVVGWIAYLRDAPRWADRPVHIAMGVVAFGAILAIARVVPGRYGYWLELGVMLAVVYAIGCFIGWALRDLAEFTPATARAGATASAAATGSYLFRDAYAGTGASSPYMRTAAEGAPARQPLPLGDGALTRAPAAGGYTFPKTAPFADATTSQAGRAAPGLRRHWSWPRPAGVPPYVTPEFAGSKGGYIFPAAAVAAAAETSQSGLTRAGQYRHWSWRGDGAAPAATATAAPEVARRPHVASAGGSTAAGRSVTTPGFTGSRGGYVFPVAAVAAPTPAREGTTGAGLYRHWSWRGAGATPDSVTAAGGSASPAGATQAGTTPGATGSAALSPVDGGQTTSTPPAAAAAGAGATVKSSTSDALASVPPAPDAAGVSPASDTVPGVGVPTSAAAPVTTTNGHTASDLGSPAAVSTPATSAGSPAEATRSDASAAPVSPPSTPAVTTQPGGHAGGTTASPEARSDPGAAPSSTAAAPTTATPTSTPSPAAGQPGPGAIPASSGDPTGRPTAAGPGGSNVAETGAAAGPALTPSPRPTLSDPTASESPSGTPTGAAHPTATSGAGAAGMEAVAAGGQADAKASDPASSSASLAPAVGGGSSGAMGDDASPLAPPTATTPAEAGVTAAPPAAPGEPATIAAVPGEDRHSGQRPEGLMTARDNRADDLKRIRGIGPQNEGRLHGLGIWHFDQIAGWTPENVRWVGSYLAFPGRIDREKWVEQAATLAAGGDTAFSTRVRAGKVAISDDDGSQGQLNIADPTVPTPPKPRRPRR